MPACLRLARSAFVHWPTAEMPPGGRGVRLLGYCGRGSASGAKTDRAKLHSKLPAPGCCFPDSPRRLVAGYARDNPVYHVAASPRVSASAATPPGLRGPLGLALSPPTATPST